MSKTASNIFRNLVFRDQITSNVPFIRATSELLKIKQPEIRYPAIIYNDPDKGAIMSQITYAPEIIPEKATFIGGYSIENEIFVAKNVQISNGKSLNFVSLTEAEMLFVTLHELRHCWQRKYHPEVFFKYNTVGYQAIFDIAETDADGFAMAYYFSNQTPYTHEDMPHLLNDIFFQATADGGKRLQVTSMIAKEHGFQYKDKVSAAVDAVDKTYIKEKIKNMETLNII